MLVSVVSVVGAFRTGKSFLLTLFLRYLRQRTSGKEYKDMIKEDNWLYADGKNIAEGNRNQRNTSESTESGDKTSLRGEDEGFAWRGGQDRMTTGIWMWSEPFIHYSEEAGQDVAILLMDTQGMFDNETTMNLTAQIFSISTLVSSFQIYNVQNSIGEDKLMHLALFSEYGRIALEPSASAAGDDDDAEEGKGKEKEERCKDESGSGGEDTDADPDQSRDQIWADRSGILGDSDDDPDQHHHHHQHHQQQSALRKEPEEAQKEEKPFTFEPDMQASKLKPFQSLLFLVRDWPNFDEELETSLEREGEEDSDKIESALRAEMREYFRGVIGVRGQADLQSTREQVSRCFESVSAFLLSHPGTTVTRKNFNGSLASLEPVFRRLVGVLARMVFDDGLEPKRVGSRQITASELLAYFEVYTDLFKSGDKSFPPALTMLDATAHANNRNAYDLAFTKYRECMGTVLGEDGSTGYFPPTELRTAHEGAVQKAWKIFKSVANMGSPQAIEKLGLKLNDEITREYKQMVRENDLRNPFRDFEMYFIPLMVALVSWLSSWVLHLTCSSESCTRAQNVFSNIYGYLFVIGLIVFWQHIRRAMQYAKVMLSGGAVSAMERSEQSKSAAAAGGGDRRRPIALKRKAD